MDVWTVEFMYVAGGEDLCVRVDWTRIRVRLHFIANEKKKTCSLKTRS